MAYYSQTRQAYLLIGFRIIPFRFLKLWKGDDFFVGLNREDSNTCVMGNRQEFRCVCRGWRPCCVEDSCVLFLGLLVEGELK